MKRVLVAFASFIVFAVEFVFQLFILLAQFIKTIPTVFVLCILRYHNRIQWYTSKNNYFIIKEIKNADI